MKIKGRRVLIDGELRPATLTIADGMIANIDDDVMSDAIDLGDAVLMPGLVDTHVHINEPGRTEWEGFETATQAAAAGGITTVVDMPLNCSPVTTNVKALQVKLHHAKPKMWVDVAFWGGAVPGSERWVQDLTTAGVLGAKCFLIDSGIDEFPHVSLQELRPTAEIMASLGVPLLVHAELDLGAPTGADPRQYSTFLNSRPPEWETAAVAQMITLCRETGVHIHIVHLSAAESLPLIAGAKAEGLPFTAETCPHYLTLTADQVPEGDTAFKCCPPIRGSQNREALWAGLAEGTIDMVSSDHSPCTPHLKLPERGDFMAAWGGISSLQLGLSAIYTEASRRGHSIVDVSRWMSEQPAKLAGLYGRKGVIKVGADADLVAWSPEASFVVEPEKLRHRHKVTPYHGTELMGVISQTWLRGEPIFNNGELVVGPIGKPILGRMC